ncbi:MAG: hypothetical protein ACOYJC_01175 [Christensenellales bacterium]
MESLDYLDDSDFRHENSQTAEAACEHGRGNLPLAEEEGFAPLTSLAITPRPPPSPATGSGGFRFESFHAISKQKTHTDV